MIREDKYAIRLQARNCMDQKNGGLIYVGYLVERVIC